ncbi:MAG: poly-gamma-glutamate hydrolase family protein [Acidobacteria bacterium]|nr:poly-gamma-glutamate hydrolase family protein [Acidobacteriota bacterium]
MDLYPSFTHLSRREREGRDYRIRWRTGDSGVAIVAPHGGGIERGTSEVADGIAGREHGFYAFEGLKSVGNHVLHLSSNRFDEPQALRLVRGIRARAVGAELWVAENAVCGTRPLGPAQAYVAVPTLCGYPARGTRGT